MIDWRVLRKSDIWYVVGYIAADGNLSCDGRHITITSKDIEHLEAVRDSLRLKNKIIRKARGHEGEKKYGDLVIGDVRFYRFLLNLGLKPKKSLTLESLDIPDQFFGDFLRGVVDGDGNIRTWVHPQNDAEQWELRISSAAPIFSQWLKDKIENLFNVKGIIIVSRQKLPRHTMYVIKFGKMAAREILRKCYYEGTLSLTRKSELAHQCIKSYRGWSRSLTVLSN